MALSLSAEGIAYLHPGHWQTTVAYRWLNGDEGFIGDRVDPTYKQTIGARININSFDLQATYAFTRRFSASVTIPVLHGSVSSFRDHENDGIHRHTMSAGGFGDVRATGNMWLFDPRTHANGNVSLSLGVKTPSGNSLARDTAYRPTGPVDIPVDIAIQPGDGGWGILAEAVAFQRVSPKLFSYAAAFYLANPRKDNDAVTTTPVYGQYRPLSVPDQYQARVGVSYAAAPRHGLTTSLGSRIDGIPARDLLGDSGGFRRPGVAVYVEPGFAVQRGMNVISVFTPVAVYRNRTKNLYDDQYGGHGPGAFARFLIIASVTRRF